MTSFATNDSELRRDAESISRNAPDRPVIAYTVFDKAFVSVLKRITRNTPGDTHFGGYWLNGNFKAFTKKQLIAYQNTGLDCE